MFKNAKVFRLSAPFTLDQMALHERLMAQRFRPCGPLEIANTSALGPTGEAQPMVAICRKVATFPDQCGITLMSPAMCPMTIAPVTWTMSRATLGFSVMISAFAKWFFPGGMDAPWGAGSHP